MTQLLKLILLNIVLNCCQIHNSSAQNLKITETSEYKDNFKIDRIQTVYTSENGKSVVVRYDNKNMVFDVFDEGLKKLYTKSREKDKKEYYLGDVLIDDKVIVFTESFSNVTSKKIKTYSLNLDDSTLSVNTISTSDINKRAALYSNVKGSKMEISPDGNSLALVSFSINRNTLFYHFQVFDVASFKLMFEHLETLEENEYFELSDVIIDNERTIYAFSESHFDASDPKKIFNSKFLIKKVNQTEQKSVKITLGNRYIESLKPSLIEDKFHLISLYSDSNTSNINGVCNIIINKSDLTISASNYNKIPERVFENLFGSDYKDKRKEPMLTNFKVDKLLKDKQDNLYLIAEKFYYTQNSNNPGKTPNHEDLILIKFKNTGDLEWGLGLFKRSFEPSYNAFIKENNLHLILNSGKDLEVTKDGNFIVGKKFFQGTSLYDFVYNQDGELNLDKIQDNKKQTIYNPYLGSFVNQKFVMPSEASKERKFMILE